FNGRKSLLAEPLPSKSRTESFSDDFTTDDPSSGGSTVSGFCFRFQSRRRIFSPFFRLPNAAPFSAASLTSVPFFLFFFSHRCRFFLFLWCHRRFLFSASEKSVSVRRTEADRRDGKRPQGGVVEESGD
ncbi:hypothetical protein PIB30_107565, partial [Stylosanthes scabra]|nr:hypothetical protein [Stylosanthes scabra]